MGKSTKKKNKKITAPKANIQELSISRDGGQIALRGYSYQFLYSCYLILSSSNPSNFFQLEGIEDIDCIMQKNGSNDITHIQLKYSVNKQDASFLTDVLKNFLEAYLLDQNRFFKLVYDFPVAKGHLSKIFASKLDEKSRTHWAGVISNIKKNNPSWNWSVYDFDKFISHLSFEKIEKSILATEIEKTLIRIYEINTDNVSLFANSIKILCFEKMEQRAYVTKAELDSKIQSVKIDISKGPQNPAHSWIRKLDYSKPSIDEGCSFYEGKKATPADIVSGFPIKRPSLEKDVINSICENMVTVIKASSGQGKTTLALRAAYILQNEYIPYQLLWCDEIKEIGNIVQYFKARIQLGEKILILIDNLDNHLSKWNYLVQLLQSELHCHYKLLITSREMDWYNYSGDLSNIQSLKVIKPVLEEKEAIEIFNLFREAKQLHPSITSWQRAWNKIAERQLLIEYVYLLTHGEMLSERIASQISEIGQSSSGKAKCEILRKVCFADLCGVRLSAIKLSASQSEDSGSDFGELLKGMESEFLVHVNEESGYIEGLHPIRSKHVVKRLHEFLPIDNTAISVMKMADKADLSILFSHLPEFTLNKETFFRDAVESLWDEKDLSNYTSAIQGLFSGSVMQYFLSNRAAFDDADAHGGLFLLSTEMCPFAVFEDFGVSMDTLDKMRETFPDNKNIEYLCRLRERIPTCCLQETYVYIFCDCLYRKMRTLNYWFDVREHICLLADKCCACIYKRLGGKPLGSLAGEVDQLREEFALITTGEKRYPKEDRPFEEKATVPERLGKIKSKYFQSIQNFMNQFAGFLIKNEQKQRLAMVNLTIAQSALVTMQNYFAEIAIDFSFQERQLTLCVMETQNIERLIMCCSYYQTHSPNKYFNKYQISNWYDGHCRDERKIVEDGLSELESKYSIHFPDQIYTIDMLSYYPIIVGNFDMASESNLTEWLLGCIAFADAPFDYLVILSANESKEIDSTALQFPRRMLVDVKKAIESENHSLLDKLVPPYPVNVTAQMLDCFSEKYDLPEKKVTDVDELPIGYIAEELWIYSKSVELLTEPEDACYLAAQTQDIQLNITEMLCLLKNKLPVKDVDWLIEICDNVFSGEKFDDIMFNNVIEHFIQKKIEQ